MPLSAVTVARGGAPANIRAFAQTPDSAILGFLLQRRRTAILAASERQIAPFTRLSVSQEKGLGYATAFRCDVTVALRFIACIADVFGWYRLWPAGTNFRRSRCRPTRASGDRGSGRAACGNASLASGKRRGTAELDTHPDGLSSAIFGLRGIEYAVRVRCSRFAVRRTSRRASH